GWVGKGYGFPQAWLRVGAPFATLAHPLMVYPRLPVTPERRVDLIATQSGSSGPKAQEETPPRSWPQRGGCR
ncbi:MAG: hypothetical protein ABDH20_01930, partial [Thermus sp.]